MVRALIASAVLAGLVAVVSVPWIAGALHPPLCSTVGSGVDIKSFCISWDPTKGRYETPPAPVPADFGARHLPTVDPTFAWAALVFVGATIALWFGLRRLFSRWRTSRVRDVDAGS